MKETIYDIQTGEITIRDYTAEEIAAVEAAKEAAAEAAAAAEIREAARLAALAKLGLTADEIAALGL